jgi:nucleotide-binding universal stress UspA family protein
MVSKARRFLVANMTIIVGLVGTGDVGSEAFQAALGWRRWMFRKVVVALDGSEESKRAAELAEAIARRFRSDVLVVHIRELAYTGANTWDSEWAPEVEASMAELVRRLTAQGRPASSEILEAPEGHEGQEIADAAARIGADLIVMGSRGRSRVAEVVLGSVAGSVIHHASCPVLVAR